MFHSAFFSVSNELAFFVENDDGLYVEHRADRAGKRGKSAAPNEIFKVVRNDEVLEFAFYAFYVIERFLRGFAFVAHIYGDFNERALTDRGRAAFYAKAVKIGEVFAHFAYGFSRDVHRVAQTVAYREMHRVFNNGIGMAVIVSREDADKAEAAFRAQGETVYRIGTIVERPEGAPGCVVL